MASEEQKKLTKLVTFEPPSKFIREVSTCCGALVVNGAGGVVCHTCGKLCNVAVLDVVQIKTMKGNCICGRKMPCDTCTQAKV